MLIQEVLAPGYDDYDPFLSQDELELYFASNRPGINNSTSASIWKSTRTSVTEPWGMPAEVTELKMQEYDERSPKLAPDGLTMLFGRAVSVGNYDIWGAKRSDSRSPWGNISTISELNSLSYDLPGGSDSPLRMILSSERPDGTHWDMYEVTRATTDATWGAPVAVSALNTAGADELGAYLNNGGTVVYYGSDVLGSDDLYVATRETPDVPFGAPVPLSDINDPSANDNHPWVSADGRYIVFNSNRVGGKYHLFEATR